MAKLEFYVGKADKHIAVVDDGAVPRQGEHVNIRKLDFLVGRVTWAVDNSDDLGLTKLRANVELIPRRGGPK